MFISIIPTQYSRHIVFNFTKCLEKDSCGGDSGGPLITKKKIGALDIYTVIGLVSWGPDACGGNANEYGIYTNVAYYNDWILNNIS